MARFARALAVSALVSIFVFGGAGPASAQSTGAMEAVMDRNMTLPRTAWIKAETLGGSVVEQGLHEAVNLHLRGLGYIPERFSPYAVRIEVRGAGVEPVEPAIPQYANPQPRLSLWNAASGSDIVTVSLLLYHQSTGRALWQAEATCRGLPADAIASAMVAPMMGEFGRTTSARLACTRAS